MTLKELKDQGFKCFVKHHRVFEANGQSIGLPIIDTEQDEVVGIDNVLTRGEFERAMIKYELYIDDGEDFYVLGPAEYGECVSPRGGFTEVELINENGKVLKGKYNFNKKLFCRKNGLRAALGRALNHG